MKRTKSTGKEKQGWEGEHVSTCCQGTGNKGSKGKNKKEKKEDEDKQTGITENLQDNMSVDLAHSESPPCPKASNSRELSPVPEMYRTKKDYASSQMPSAKILHMETFLSSSFLYRSAYSEQS